MRPLVRAAIALVLVAACPAVANAARGCREEIGPKRSAELVRQCMVVSPATRPPCNAVNPCALIRSEIRRGCEIVGADAPAFCGSYTGPADEDEDEDDEDGDQ